MRKIYEVPIHKIIGIDTYCSEQLVAYEIANRFIFEYKRCWKSLSDRDKTNILPTIINKCVSELNNYLNYYIFNKETVKKLLTNQMLTYLNHPNLVSVDNNTIAEMFPLGK